MAPSIRGVSLFIQDVRNAPSSSREQARVLQELSKIRQRFAHPKKPLTGYEKKKCLTKLLYIHLLGYPVDIGHAEAISLLSSPHYSERSAAFLFCSLLLVDSHTASRDLPDLRSLCCSSIKKELSLQHEDFAALALDCASYISDPDAAAELFPLMQATANPSSSASPLIRQKAYSCMLVFFRLRPSLLPCEVWASRLGQALLFEQDLSCLLSLVNLIFHAVLQTSQLHRWQQQLQLSAINILARILSRDVPENLFYRGIPAPWLAVRLLQLLQCFQVSGGKREVLSDEPSRREDKRRDREEDSREDEAVVKQQREAVALSLNEIVKTIFTQVATANEEEALPHQSRSSTLKGRKSHSFSAFRASSLSTRLASLSRLPQRQSSSGKGDRTGGSGDAAVPQRGTSFFSRKKGLGAHAVSPSVIQHAVLYEAISLSTHLQADADKDLKLSAAALLCSFVEEGDSNFRYKSLSLVAAMAADPDVHPELKGAVPAILRLLEEEDVSLRRQAISLLFALSGPDNWSEIVLALLESLHRDAETLPNISAHIAVLVETYAPDPTWLVDVAFQMLQRAPQHVRDETWVHVIQVVSGSSSSEPSDERDGDKLSGRKENSASVGRPDVELQRYAASRAAEFLEDAFLNEPLLRLCAYLLGHFGHLIKARVPGRRQIDALLFHFRRFVSASSFLSPGNFPPFTFIPLNDEAPAASCCPLLPLLLFALVKLAHAFPADSAPVLQVLQELHDSRDLELQTRAVELSALLELPDRQFVAQTLALLPPYRRRQLLSRPPPPRALAGSGGGRTTRAGANRAAEERLSAHLRAAPAATREAVAAVFSSSPRATGRSCETRGRRGSSRSPQRESFERERSSSESSPSRESSDGNSESDRDSRDTGEESGEETGGRQSEDRRGGREERERGRRSSDSSGAGRSVESAESEEEREHESRGSSRSSSVEREEEERRMQEKFMELLKSHPLPQSQNPEDQNRELWKRACIASEGTLCLLPGLLEVYVHRKFDKKDGMLLLEWRNLSRDKLLGLQRGSPPNSPEMLLKDEGFRPGEATWVEGSGTEVVNILPLRKAIQRIRLRCLKPFSAPPKLACLLCVSTGANQPPQQIQLPLSLPVVMANFLVPAKAVNEGSVFLRYWKQLLSREEEREGERGGESKEKVIVGPLALPPHQVPLFLSAGFKFHVIKVGRSLCGSGTFHTGTPAAGASSGASPRFVCASSMCTVELNPNVNPLLARITVRAAHPRVSLYLSRLLGFHLLRASAPPSSSSLVQASPEFALQSGSSPFAAPAGGENPAPPLSRGAGVVSAMPGTRASVNLSTAQVAGGPPLFPSASAGSPTGLTPQNFYRMTT